MDSELAYDPNQLTYFLVVTWGLHKVIYFVNLTLKISRGFQILYSFVELFWASKLISLHGSLETLERSVSVILDLLIIYIHIYQTEVFLIAVRALNCVVFILLCFLRLPPYAKSANIIIAAIRNQDMIEISEANRAVIFVYLSQFPIFLGLFYRIFFHKLYLILQIACIDSYFVSILYRFSILHSYFTHDSLLFGNFLFNLRITALKAEVINLLGANLASLRSIDITIYTIAMPNLRVGHDQVIKGTTIGWSCYSQTLTNLFKVTTIGNCVRSDSWVYLSCKSRGMYWLTIIGLSIVPWLFVAKAL